MIIHNNKQYQSLIDEIDTLAREDIFSASFEDKLHELEALVEKTKDPILNAILAYNKSNIPYENRDFDTAREYVEEALQISKEIDFTFYIMRCYNSLAIIESQQANYYASISNYLLAFHIAEAHPEYKYGAILLNNIGNLFVWLDEYEAAISYLIRSYHKYYEEEHDNLYFISIIVLNIVEEYSLLGNYEKAKEWADLDIEHVQDAKDSIAMLLATNKIDVAYQNNDQNTLHKAIATIFEHAHEENNFIYVFRICLRLLQFATKAQDKNTATTVLKKAESMAKERSVGSFQHEYIVAKYQYYEAFLKESDSGIIIKELMKEYVNSSECIIKQLQDTYNRRLVIETELLKVTNEKEDAINQTRQLQKDIELDYFTQIYNKVSIEKYINEAISEKKKDSHQALLLIDIDHFKAVNDTYGHNRGDELILSVVEMISSTCSKNMLFGRFGGDEFILYVKNARQIKYFETLTEELLARAQDIKISQEKHITLSIGIYIIENNQITFKEAIQKADEALYETKHRGRNGYSIHMQKKS